ncbi:MAG: 2-oxoacid:ferredoxin oxidoreductase subunit beta [Synergistaceae bacterium]|jgi:2-oxoglutarate ferredoxin oxidoreductase subunit beta|nr:2-oxoacid:ferredoxin oxidoreductase subunit beta [Synergistaceae bacterium]
MTERTERKEHIFDKYLRQDKLPHIWCPGCGNGTVVNALLHAIDKTGLEQDKIVLVAGIGCSSRANGYMNFCGMHTNHGRALAYATGVKMHNPELKVIVLTGDGDCTSIGGNHFIHACRRNIDITTVVFNNANYGMTGGQYSPTTPVNARTKTSVYGNIEPNFDICSLAATSGATYVARSTIANATMMVSQFEKALNHRGFSVVEAICDCPTLFGRINKLGDAVAMLADKKTRFITAAQAKNMTPDELSGKIITGEFVNRTNLPEYTEQYDVLIKNAKEEE